MFPLSGGRCEAGPLGRREDVAAQVSLQDEIRRLGPDTDQLNMQRGEGLLMYLKFHEVTAFL